MMNERGQSDDPVVPRKSSNKEGVGTGRSQGHPYTGTQAETPDTAKGEPTGAASTRASSAEGMEERRSAEGNLQRRSTLRTQGRERVQQALARVRQVAARDKGTRFTALFHHVYSPDTLREAYFRTKRDAAPGVDGETWQHYGTDLENNLLDLSGRLKRGAYRAKPVKRAYIAKANGRLRPLGVPALEDKVVQRAMVMVLNAVYETDFLGFSYGFRAGRNQHNALDALYTGLLTKKVNWVLDADIRGFFDTIDHEWLVKFVEHRIADKRVVRHIRKWLNAGVLEDGVQTVSEVGTVQGGSISPLLANIYLHYVLDLWVQQWRESEAQGDVIIVRYADDFVVGFQHKHEAERFLAQVRDRFARFGLELHPEKTRLIEFGQWAGKNRNRRGEGKPDTFNFLGFTHVCHKKLSNGRFTVLRLTMRERLTAKLKDLKLELRRRLHWSVLEVGTWLRSVVFGHMRYYAVPMNRAAVSRFRFEVARLWHRALERRSQNGRVRWERMYRLIDRYLPPVRVCHPYPLQRLGVIT